MMANALLLPLWLLWVSLLVGGFLFGRPDAARTRRMPRWTRMGSSLALVAAAGGSAGLGGEGWLWLVALGMTLGFVGDLFMAGLLVRGRQHVLGGMVAFGLGHVAYIVALGQAAAHYGLGGEGRRWLAVGAWWLVALAGWYLVVWRGGSPTRLHRAALPYALLLASTAGLATGLAWQAAAFAPVAVGAALFLVSDLILAAQLFNGLRFPLVSDVVWLLYGPGQMGIVFGAWLAQRTLG